MAHALHALSARLRFTAWSVRPQRVNESNFIYTRRSPWWQGAVRGLGGVARARGAPGSLEEAEASMEMDRAGVVTSVQLVWISLLHMCTGRCLR